MAKKEENPVYEVFDSQNHRVLYSYSLKCIDSKSRIEELLKTGHKLKINGKPVTKTKITEILNSIKEEKNELEYCS